MPARCCFRSCPLEAQMKGSYSIVLPAHDEASVIHRCLQVIADISSGIVVVANGCSDRTAEIAREAGAGVTVIETAIASKSRALNLGDAASSGFPRFYIDADVVIHADSILRMAKRLERGDVLAVSPTVKLELDHCSWPVRAFYAIDQRLPSARETIGGSGVYGLSEAGRARFKEFPAITADDAFVRRQFEKHERCVVEDAVSVVTPPATLAGVIAIKTRSHFGNYELDELMPQLTRNVGASNRKALSLLALRPWLWPKLGVYAYVKLLARMRARRRIRAGIRQWERDDTSRELAGAGQG
jgi:glycosyltransferase involved in cell wall biosynthesis